MRSDYSFGNLDNVEATKFDPIPVGIYELRCTQMEMKDTKSGDGSYLACTFTVQGPTHEGRLIFSNFNLINKNQTTVEIALRDIKAWMEACGLPTGGELTMARINALEGKKFQAKVGIEKDKSGQFDDKNRIARFLSTDAKSPNAAPSKAAPAPIGDWALTGDALPPMGTPAASAPGKRPWE